MRFILSKKDKRQKYKDKNPDQACARPVSHILKMPNKLN